MSKILTTDNIFRGDRVKKCISVIVCILILIINVRCYAAPGVSAQTAILVEKNSARVLYEKNADKRMPMASTTKIITAITVLEKDGINLDEPVEISENAAGVEGSSMYLEKGEKMTIRELLYGLMLSSGNDAAVALAEAVSGSQEDFVSLMNDKVYEIGARNTHLTNPNGLPDDEHYSTARDMARITSYALNDPTFSEIVKTKAFKIEGEGKAYSRTLTNHNKLLNMYDGCVGVKTGFTKAAGRCLVSSAVRENMNLICVTLNAPDDWNDHMSLYDFGYDKYKYKKIVSNEVPLCSANVNGSVKEEVSLYAGSDVHYPLYENEGYSVETEIYPGLSAPLKKGEQVGRVMVELSGRKAEIPLVVYEDIEAEPITKRFGEKLAESVKAFFSLWVSIVR